RGLDADARARLDEAGIILAPQLAPASIDDDGVARLQRDVLLLQRALEIFDRDLVSVAEHFDALVAGDVDQRTDVVNPELRKPGTGRVLGDLEAIVPAVLVGLVGKAVELSANLPDLGNDDLLIAAAPVGEIVHKVRLTCTSKRRVPKNGIFVLSTCPSSMTSPVLMSLTALSTVCGFMWLPEPRSSPAPHFDGQR